MTIRRVTFRLYPTPAQERQLFEWRRLHCYLYNAALEHRITSYRQFGKSVNYFNQSKLIAGFRECWPEYAALGVAGMRGTLRRVDFAFQRFFKGLGGYPRFKSIRRYSGWSYLECKGWRVLSNGTHGKLKLTNLGEIRMRGQARTWGTPKTCDVIYRPSEGKWYASITVECQPQRELGVGSIGLDFGCKTAVATSDGELIEAPKFLAHQQKQIRQLSKQLRRKRKPEKRRVKASRRWKKTQKRIGKLKRKVAQQRQNWVHQVAAQIASRNSLVATEKLNLKAMTRKGKTQKRQKAALNRSLLDVGIGMLKDAIAYKVREGGGFFLEAPTQQLKPTQRCAQCWELTPKTLSDRQHVCQHCGHSEDRDINAAQVMEIWARGAERASLDAESASATDCGSFRQLAARKRQKLSRG